MSGVQVREHRRRVERSRARPGTGPAGQELGPVRTASWHLGLDLRRGPRRPAGRFARVQPLASRDQRVQEGSATGGHDTRSPRRRSGPALAKAPERGLSAAHSGSTPASTINGVVAAVLEQGLGPACAAAAAAIAPAGGEEPTCETSVDPGGGRRAAPPAVAVRRPPGLRPAAARPRSRANRRPVCGVCSDGLKHDGVAGHERGADRPARRSRPGRSTGSSRATPRGSWTMGRGGRGPLQRAAAVQRAELGVLLEGRDARLDPAARVPERLARLVRR